MNIDVQRIPRWIVVIGVIGTPIAGLTAGPASALGFAAGAAGSWWNFRYLQKAVAGLADASSSARGVPGILAALFARFLVLGIGSIVILKYSRTSLIALLTGLFASCIAIFVEILYELLWKNTKSG